MYTFTNIYTTALSQCFKDMCVCVCVCGVVVCVLISILITCKDWMRLDPGFNGATTLSIKTLSIEALSIMASPLQNSALY